MARGGSAAAAASWASRGKGRGSKDKKVAAKMSRAKAPAVGAGGGSDDDGVPVVVPKASARQQQAGKSGAAGGAASSGADGQKKRKAPAHCFGCGCASASSPWAQYSKVRGQDVPVGLGDLECYRTYSAAYKHLGTFDEVMEKCHLDAAFKTKFMHADKIRKQVTTADFDLADVMRVNQTGYKAYRCLVGLSEAEFQAKFGKSTKEAKAKLIDLPNEQGQTYRGVLMYDSDRPGVRYEVYHDSLVNQALQKMTAAKHLWNGQETEVFAAEKKALRAKGTHLQRLCTAGRAESEVAGQGNRGLGSSGLLTADELGEELDDEEGEEEEESDKDQVVESDSNDKQNLCVVAAAASGGLGSAALAKSLKAGSVAGSVVRKSSCHSIADGTTLSGEGDDDIPSAHKKRKLTTDDWIDKLDLMLVLGGKAMARKRTFAQAHLDELPTTASKRAVLAEHLELVDHAMRIADSDIDKADDAFLQQHLEPCLAHLKGALPTTLKTKLFNRYVSAKTSCAHFAEDGNIERFLLNITPWAPDDLTDEEQFSWRSPRLCMIEGSPAELASTFKSALESCMVPLVQAGSEGKAVVKNFSRVATAFFKSAFGMELEDSFVQVLSDASTVWRGLLCLLDPTETEHMRHCTNLLARAPKGASASLPAVVRAVMARTDSYDEVMADFNQRGASNVLCMNEYLQVCVKLKKDGNDFDELRYCIQKFPELSQKMRVSLVERLTDIIGERVNEVAKEYEQKAATQSNNMSAAEVAEFHETHKALFEDVVKHMLPVTPNAKAWLQAAQSKAAECKQSLVMDEFVSEISALAGASGEIDIKVITKATDLANSVTNMEASLLSKADLRKSIERSCGQLCSKVASSENLTGELPTALLDLLSTVRTGINMKTDDPVGLSIRAHASAKQLLFDLDLHKGQRTEAKDAVDADPKFVALLRVRSSFLSLKDIMDKLGEQTGKSPLVVSASDEADKWLVKCTDYVLSTKAEPVERLVKEVLALTGKNMTETTDWKSTTKAKTWDGLRSVADKSLLKIHGDALSKLNNELKVSVSALKVDSERLDSQSKKGVLDTGEKILEGIRLLEKEAYIFTAFNQLSTEPLKLRKVLVAYGKEPPRDVVAFTVL